MGDNPNSIIRDERVGDRGNPPVPDILTLASKERFRRILLISARIIAVFLILAILWIGFLQLTYVKELNELKGKYGNLAYCYMCGYENLRKCSCQYIPELRREIGNFNISDLQLQTALNNVAECLEYTVNKSYGDYNFTINSSNRERF